VFLFTITEFSVRTGKPVQVLYQRRTGHESESESELWVNTSGGTIIASRGESATSLQSVAGVQTPKAFTPFPRPPSACSAVASAISPPGNAATAGGRWIRATLSWNPG
jgi:hypothetical protein